MAVEASIVVSFGEGVISDTVVVEFDPEHTNNLDSDGNVKSTFDSDAPDQPVILLHYGSTLSVGSISLTAGTLSEIGGPLTQERKDDVTFSKVGDTSGITYANASLIGQPAWVGGLSGTVEVSDTNLKLIAGGPCTGEATLNVTFQKQYMLTPPTPIVLDEDGNYQITIFIFMIGA